MDGLLRLFFLSFNYVFFPKNVPKTKSKIWIFFQYILKSKQVEYVSALWNLKNDYKKKLQPCEKNFYRLATTAKCGGDGCAAPSWCCSVLLLVILTAVSWLFPFPFSQETEEGFTSAITSLLGSSKSSSSHSFILGFNFSK